jgi:cellulose synthase/poly-beta-1,6-N-acetylglucosamine synthase-like glycosyltransferase
MLFWKCIFLSGFLIIFYNYIGYALIVYIANKLGRKFHSAETTDYYPSVSFIVAAYNEEDFIEKKIINSLQQTYPASKIEFIIITDGSTDKTALIVQRYPKMLLLHEDDRRGKSAALNRAVLAAKNDILIISDANTFLNKDAVKYITSHYSDNLIGGVAGEKKVVSSPNDTEGIGVREGLYWKYESFLKRIDSEFYSVVGAAGELFSIRKNLYEPLPETVILDDFVTSLKTAQKGFRIVYEPRAYAMEASSVSFKDEQKRKIRIAAGGFQAIKMLASLFYFWKHPKLTFLFISHRVLRWTLSPLCLILLLVSNIVLAFISSGYFYKTFLALQVLFYLTAFTSQFITKNSKLKFLKFTGYFVFMNLSVIAGFFRFISNRQSVVWEKAKRSSINIKSE